MKKFYGVAVVFVCCSFLSGCSYTASYGAWGWTCDWCKTRVSGNFWVEYDGSGTTYLYRDGVQVKTYQGEPDSRQVKQDISSTSFESISYGGNRFCSLRCLNAYKASTEIKEDRFRIIQNE